MKSNCLLLMLSLSIALCSSDKKTPAALTVPPSTPASKIITYRFSPLAAAQPLQPSQRNQTAPTPPGGAQLHGFCGKCRLCGWMNG